VNKLEAEALAGAGLSPAIERLAAMLANTRQVGDQFVSINAEFIANLISLLTRCRDTLEAQSEMLATRHPLTETEIRNLVGAVDDFWATSKTWITAIARATEAAHGIGSKP
jgi:hypothetical protein